MHLYDLLLWNRRLLLDLQTREFVGTLTYDHSRAHHIMTLHGTPAWRQNANDLNYLDFDAGNPDFIDCPAVATADLDFTSGDFSLACWVAYGGVGFRYLMARGLTDTDGWEWAITTDNELWLRTSQAAAHQDTTSAEDVVPLTTWTFLATVRDGASVVHYVNGVQSLGTAGTHVNPLTANRELHVGINDAEAAGFYDGGLWRPRIWSGALSLAQIQSIYRLERGMLGV